MYRRQSGRTSTRLARYPKNCIQVLAGAVSRALRALAATKIFPTLSRVGRASWFGMSISAPRNTGCWVGVRADFSQFIRKPRLWTSPRVNPGVLWGGVGCLRRSANRLNSRTPLCRVPGVRPQPLKSAGWRALGRRGGSLLVHPARERKA